MSLVSSFILNEASNHLGNIRELLKMLGVPLIVDDLYSLDPESLASLQVRKIYTSINLPCEFSPVYAYSLSTPLFSFSNGSPPHQVLRTRWPASQIPTSQGS